jgi:AhpC/TSA family protein/cytochrome c biogenesis DsbD-like protein
VQPQNAKQRFEAQGLKLAAISYDSPAILKDFAKRQRIDFPLLADPRFEIIRSVNVLNAEAKGMTKGMAYPGFFYIDETGVIREKYFEAKYTYRFTANNVIGKLFPELTEEVSQNVEAPHLRLTLTQSDRTVAPGSRVTLAAEIELLPDVHVYSPGVKGYKPIQLPPQPLAEIEFSAAAYPSSKILYLEAIQERVPVFDGKFRIIQDVTVTPSKTRDVARSVVSAQKTISITGELKYQACDKAVCYLPTSVPVKWQLQVLPLDLKRSPKGIHHKQLFGVRSNRFLWKEKTMSDVVYVSESCIERRQGPLRIAHLPGESQPVVYSVHGAIAEHYRVDPATLKESHSSTIDYVISATAG